MRRKSGSKKKQEGRQGGEDLEPITEETLKSASNANQIVICKVSGCHDIATTKLFCRFHYLTGWKRLKTKEAKKKGQELEAYLEELGKRFPEEFLEKLKGEIEEFSERETSAGESDDSEKSLFDQADGDEDLDTIIKGLRVEDI